MIKFFVPGKPQAQGSKVKGRYGNMREANSEVGPWRERVALEAYKHGDGVFLPAGTPIKLILFFVLYRPLGAPKRSTPPATKKPDLDKMTRAIMDALTNVLWADDAQVVAVHARKRVAEPDESPGVHVWVAATQNTPSNSRAT